MTDLPAEHGQQSAPPALEAAEYRVQPTEQDTRLDVFLAARIPQLSRVQIRRGIDTGTTTVDGRPRKGSFKLSTGQVIKFCPPPPAASGPAPEPIPLDILFEDEAIAVVNKPAGMVVHPAKGHWSGTLASALVHHFEHLSSHGGPTRPGIVHRLDRDTSGVLIVAKHDDAHRRLAHQFQQRSVRKEYLALVRGIPDRDRDWIDVPIGDHPRQRERKAIRADHASSRPAQTFYEVQRRLPPWTLVRTFPKTGRTHQIRLHLAHIGCPILCDKLYGGCSQLTAGELRTTLRQPGLAAHVPDSQVLLARQALHAERLCLPHPVSGEALEFTAPLPPDMQELLLLLQHEM